MTSQTEGSDSANAGDPQAVWRSKVLTHLAERLGPIIDQVDIVGPTSLPVRDVLEDLVDEGVGTPAELRCAMLDLSQEGLIGLRDDDLVSWTATVRLRARGLVEARKVQPGIGRPCHQVRLRLQKGGSGFLARFDTGCRERDRELNSSGVVLAVFYVLALEQPTSDAPLTVKRVQELGRKLAALGIGPKSGPGARVDTSDDTVRKALGQWTGVLKLESSLGEDGKKRRWYLAGGFPEVRVTAPVTGESRDWQILLQRLRQELRDRKQKSKAQPDAPA
ncbi:MAG: hypothetical protein AB7O97_21725 [Planctomycetota bacterium]